MAEPTLPLAYPAQPDVRAGQPADALPGEVGAKSSTYEHVVGQPSVPNRVGRLGDIADGLARRCRRWSDLTIRLAANRAISPNSLTGISLLLSLSAAAWFSGGTRADDVRGLICTGAWVVVRAGARQLAAVTAQRTGKPSGRGTTIGRRRQHQPNQSDWLVLPGFNWSAEDLSGQPGIRKSEIRKSEIRQSEIRQSEIRKSDIGVVGRRDFGWFYAVCATAGECAIYGGIAAGGQSAGWTGTWPLAVAIVVVGSVTAIARTCGASPSLRREGAAAVTGQGGGSATWVSGLLAGLSVPPVGVGVLFAALIMVGYGPRIALVAVLALGVVSLARNVIRTGNRLAAGRRGAAASPAGRAAMAGVNDVLLACRDDGPVARRIGWLVRGNLMPLPPAVAGLVAIGLLAVLGIRTLPGIVALTPVVVLLLAAPGSSHPHDGRFDWLVPVLLCLAQYGYLAALGAAKSVSPILVFAACSMTAVWYASLAASRRTEGIGWEGRVGVVGLAGMFGIATFGYLGLTVCLGTLIGRKAVIDYLRQEEDQRQ